ASTHARKETADANLRVRMRRVRTPVRTAGAAPVRHRRAGVRVVRSARGAPAAVGVRRGLAGDAKAAPRARTPHGAEGAPGSETCRGGGAPSALWGASALTGRPFRQLRGWPLLDGVAAIGQL